MAVGLLEEPTVDFSAWYTGYDPEGRDGCLEFHGLSDTEIR